MSGIEPAAWSAAETALWERIAGHAFERPALSLDFVGRLASDMGWSRGFALAAVEEYRRFCFLAMTGRDPATPSEEVDAVWHLHLTYSRDYWQAWCGQVLRGELHHDPTAGGAPEGARFREQYAATLARYERYFGPPDPRFWPGTKVRFGARPRYRMVDTRRALVLPRPRIALPWRAAMLLIGLASVLLPEPVRAQGATSSLDLNGPAFLALYAKVAAIALGLSLALALATRWALRAAIPDREPGDLDIVELAYVAGGPHRAADVVALTLLSSGAASLGMPGLRLVIDSPEPAVPAAVRPFLACADGPTPRPVFARAVKERLGPMVRDLVSRGLVPDPGLRRLLAAVSMAPVAAALAFGLAKVAVGLSRGRPVGYLVTMMVVLGVATAALHLLQPIVTTRAGDRALARSRLRHARAARAPLPAELPLAFALVGLAALEAADPVQAAYLRFMQTSTAGGSGSGCGGGGGGDGGGGGGHGCGGGGCGGCGGGGGD